MRKKGEIEASGGEQPHDPEVPIRLATFDQYRSLLFSVAYRMLGSVADAQDMLQEAFIRWQQAPDEDIRSPRAFLVTILKSSLTWRNCLPIQVRQPGHKCPPGCSV